MTFGQLGKKILMFVLAFYMASTGIVLLINSNLGAGPWDIFHLGLTNYVPLTMGQVGQIVGVILIFVGLLLGEKPGLGTITNMYLIGFFIDVIREYELIPHSQILWQQLLMVALGIYLFGWATYIYLKQGMCSGPRDALMVGLIKKTGKPIWLIRTLIEGAVMLSGYLMGGPIGLGTVFFMLFVGASVQHAFKVGKVDAAKIEHQDIFETFRLLCETYKGGVGCREKKEKA